jgi:hypothetical protein
VNNQFKGDSNNSNLTITACMLIGHYIDELQVAEPLQDAKRIVYFRIINFSFLLPVFYSSFFCYTKDAAEKQPLWYLIYQRMVKLYKGKCKESAGMGMQTG